MIPILLGLELSIRLILDPTPKLRLLALELPRRVAGLNPVCYADHFGLRTAVRDEEKCSEDDKK